MNQIKKSQISDYKLSMPRVSNKTRSAAIKSIQRSQNDADKVISKYTKATTKVKPRANQIIDEASKLKLTFLGGLEGVGEKNMAVLEYADQAIILDCGNSLGIDLPGVNYEINDTSYLEMIKHKIKAYVITHGHLDHMGGLKHIVPNFPAPIYGSRYTIGVIERSFNENIDFEPELVIVNIDRHERLKIGIFFVEFIRVTHAIPDPSAICIDTPVGRVLATGDFRLDPEPLDNLPSDIKRLKQLGEEGVLILMSDSSYADTFGRTPTEHTLQASFHDVIANASGRIFVAVFSSNINRTQMIIDAALKAGRSIALDGRSMLGYVEIAVRQGILKVPKGMIIPLDQTNSIADDKLLVMCTGGQGEPNAALKRISEGEHKFFKLKQSDTVVISSSPIPGNEVKYDEISNHLSQKGVNLFRHTTHELDGCGPLHVSGHARRDELMEMIQLINPKYFIPVHANNLRRKYHTQLAIEVGIPSKNCLLPQNGDSIFFSSNSAEYGGQVPHGSLLIDQTGSLVSGLVVKDRLLLSEMGILSVILTIDKKSGKLLTSPDIISRGFVAMNESEDLMKLIRSELKRAVNQRYNRVELDRFKSEIRDFISHFMFEHTGLSPIVIPVVNVVNGNDIDKFHQSKQIYTDNKLIADQKRFHDMRQKLLIQRSKVNS